MRLVTWNVNSPRLRLDLLRRDLLRRWVQKEQPDVVRLQAIKMQDSELLKGALKAFSHPHIPRRGMKSVDATAIRSRPSARRVPPVADGR